MDTINKLIIHYVPPEGEGNWDADWTIVVAICGASCIIDPEGEPIPSTFDFVFSPDTYQITDCWDCLSKLAEPAHKHESTNA